MRDNLAAQNISMPTVSKVMKILFGFFFPLFTCNGGYRIQGAGGGGLSISPEDL